MESKKKEKREKKKVRRTQGEDGNKDADLLENGLEDMGRGYGDICICIADSLCYKAETNTPL